MRGVLVLAAAAVCSSVICGCSNSERPAMDLVYTGWVSEDLKRELNVQLARIAYDSGVRLRIWQTRDHDSGESTPRGALVVRVLEDAERANGGSHAGLRLRIPELPDLNGREVQVSQGGSTCLVLVDVPEIQVSNDARPRRKGNEELIRMPSGFVRTYTYSYVAPRYRSWREVRLEIAREQIQSAPAFLATLSRECGPVLARRILDDSGIASIPSHLRIDPSTND